MCRVFSSALVLSLSVMLGSVSIVLTSESNTTAIGKPAAPLPPEYRILAKWVTQEMKKTQRELLRDDVEVKEIIAELQKAIIELRNIKSADSDINDLAAQAHEAAVEVRTRIEKLNRLPKPADATDLMVEGFFAGLASGLLGDPIITPTFYSLKRSAEENQKRKAIITELEGYIAAVNKAEAIGLVLPTVAKKYTSRIVKDCKEILVDFDESWGSFGPYDWLALYNRSGQELEECTIVVELIGANKKLTNVHFVENWPSRSWMYAKYGPGIEVSDREFRRTTVESVQEIVVTILSPKLSALVRYTYQGTEKDKDIARHCSMLTLKGRYRPFDDGWLWDDEPAAILTLKGGDLPKCEVTVDFVRGAEVKSWSWDIDEWKKDTRKIFEVSHDKLPWDPNEINVLIRFPDSSYKWETKFEVRNNTLHRKAVVHGG